MVAALVFSNGAAAQTVRFLDTNPEQVGLAQPYEAGLPDGLWQGTTPQRLAAAIAGLPPRISSPAQHSMLVNLLRVAAAPPPGDSVTPSLASLRVAALARLGAEQDALDLAERVDQSLADQPLWDAQATVGLLRNDLAGVCTLTAQSGENGTSAFWQRLRAFCHLLRGQEEEAMVAVMLADELGADDPTFNAMFLARQFPQRATTLSVTPSTPLHVAMLRALNVPMIAPKWPDASPTLAAGIARLPTAGLELRTAAAERAVAANVLPADLLVQLYLATELTTPLGVAYRQAAFASSPAQQLPALDAFWSAAAAADLYAQLAPFTLANIAGLDRAAVPPDFAAKALRAAVIAGDVGSIGVWQGALRAAAFQPVGTDARDASYAIQALVGEEVPPPHIWWGAWRKAAKPSNAQAALAAGMLQALGSPAPDTKPPQADRSAAGRALAAASMGEAALLAISALSGSPPPSDGLKVQAVEALAQVDPAGARAIAVELALAAGI